MRLCFEGLGGPQGRSGKHFQSEKSISTGLGSGKPFRKASVCTKQNYPRPKAETLDFQDIDASKPSALRKETAFGPVAASLAETPQLLTPSPQPFMPSWLRRL